MLQKIRNLSNDRVKMMIVFILSLILAFGYGYLLFRYEKIGYEKEPMEIMNYDYVVRSSLQ